MSGSQALVARHPILPGAIGYLPLAGDGPLGAEDTRRIEAWLEQGASIARVPLEQAMRELKVYAQAQLAPPDDLPIMLRRQAD